MARVSWERAQQMIRELARETARGWPHHNLSGSITGLLQRLRIPFNYRVLEDFIQGLYTRIDEAAWHSVYEDDDNVGLSDGELQEAVSMLAEDPWFASDIVEEFINDELDSDFNIEGELEFLSDPTWEEARDHVWQAVRRAALGYPTLYANNPQGEGRVDEVFNALDDVGITVPRESVAWLVNRLDQEGMFQPGQGNQTAERFSTYLDEILTEEHGVFDEDTYHQRRSRSVEPPKPPEGDKSFFRGKVKNMEHRIKASPEEWSDILATLRDELRDDPNNLDTRKIYADALEDAGYSDLAEYQRALIERQNYYTPYPSWEELEDSAGVLGEQLARTLYEPVEANVQRVKRWLRDNNLPVPNDPTIVNFVNEVQTQVEEVARQRSEGTIDYDQAAQSIGEDFDDEGELGGWEQAYEEYVESLIEEGTDQFYQNPEEVAQAASEAVAMGFADWLQINPDDVNENHLGWATFQSDREDEGLPTYENLIETERGFRQRQNLPPTPQTQEPPEPEQGDQGDKSVRKKYAGKAWPFPVESNS